MYVIKITRYVIKKKLYNYIPLLLRYFILISTGIILLLSFEGGTGKSVLFSISSILSYFANVEWINFTDIT